MPIGDPVDDGHYDVENPRMDGDPENPEGESNNLLIWIIVACVITIAAITGVVLLLRGRGKKAPDKAQSQVPVQATNQDKQGSDHVPADQLSEEDGISGKTEIDVSEDPEEGSCLSTVATAAGAAVAGIGLTAAGIYAHNKLKPKPKKTGLDRLASYLPDKISPKVCIAGAVATAATAFGLKKAWDYYKADAEKRFADLPTDKEVQLVLKEGSPVKAKIVSHKTTNRTRKCVVSCEGDAQLADKHVKQIRWKVDGSRRTHVYNVDEKATILSKSGNFEIEEEVRRTALLITITYAHILPSKGRLPGTRDDGFRMKKYLESQNFTVIWMRDFEADETKVEEYLSKTTDKPELRQLSDKDPKYPSAENIKNTIKEIVAAQDSGDVLWFHYSGHGGQIKDNDGDENDTDEKVKYDPHSSNVKGAKDEVLVSADYKSGRTSYEGAMIRDDFLKKEFVNKLPPGMESFIVFDCCHSGTMFDMDYKYTYDNANDKVIKEDLKTSASDAKRGRSVYLSGCQDDECAAELTWKTGDKVSKRGGALTFALLDVLESSSGNVTIRHLLKTVDKRVQRRDQEPSISSSFDLDLDQEFSKLIDGLN